MDPQKNISLVPKHIGILVSGLFSQGAITSKSIFDSTLLLTSMPTFAVSEYILYVSPVTASDYYVTSCYYSYCNYRIFIVCHNIGTPFHNKFVTLHW